MDLSDVFGNLTDLIGNNSNVPPDPYATMGQDRPFMMSGNTAQPQPPGYGAPEGQPPGGPVPMPQARPPMPPDAAMGQPPMPQPRPNPGQDLGGGPPPPVPMPQPRPPGADALPPNAPPGSLPGQAGFNDVGSPPPTKLPTAAGVNDIGGPAGSTGATPMPMGRPPMPPQAGPAALPPNAAPASGPPPGPPPGGPGGFPQPQFNTPIEPLRPDRSQQGGGLLSAIGINLSPERKAGLAAGLKAGGMKPIGDAITGAMGAAMEGGQKRGDVEDTQQMHRNQQQFQQTSAAFNDLMKAQAAGNANKFNDARMRYFDARAKQIEASGGTGTNAWQNTPFGRSIAIRRQVEQEATEREKTYREQWKLNGTKEADQQAQLQQLDAWKKSEFAKRGQPFGLSGDQIEQISGMGLQPPKIKGPDGKEIVNPKFNPFDARSMTPEQFKALVPLNGYYRDSDGQIYKRIHDEPPKKEGAPGKQSGSEPPEASPKNQASSLQQDQEDEAAGAHEAA